MDHAQRLHPLIRSQRFLESCGRKKQHCRLWEWLRKWHIFSLFTTCVSECIFLQVFKWVFCIFSMLAALNCCFCAILYSMYTVEVHWKYLRDFKVLKIQISQTKVYIIAWRPHLYYIIGFTTRCLLSLFLLEIL